MYDMYPEWGPAKHRNDDDHGAGASVQVSLDLRDNGGPYPEDN